MQNHEIRTDIKSSHGRKEWYCSCKKVTIQNQQLEEVYKVFCILRKTDKWLF